MAWRALPLVSVSITCLVDLQDGFSENGMLVLKFRFNEAQSTEVIPIHVIAEIGEGIGGWRGAAAKH